MLLIVLTWRLPLSAYIRFNMRLVFMWFTVLSLAFYIAATVNVWIGSFLTLSLLFAHYPKPTPYSGETLLMVILGSILYLILYNVSNKEAIYTLLCLFALANVFVVSVQLLNLEFQLTRNKLLILDGVIRQGLLDNRNSLSAAFAFCLPAFFRPRWKWLIPFVLLGLVLAKSIGGVLASLPTLFYYTQQFVNKHWNISIMMSSVITQIIVCICIVLSGAILFTKHVDVPNYKARWAVWNVYGEVNSDKNHNQLLGIGLGHWKALFKREDVRRAVCRKADCSLPDVGVYYKQAHNEFIQLNFETGIIGTLIVLGFLVNVLCRVRHLSDPRPVLALLAIIISAMVYFPFHIPTLALVIILWLALLERTLRTSRLSSSS